MIKENPLGTEKISTLILKFSVPAIIGMLISALYNIVDRIFIGNATDIGSLGLAGITISFPIMIIMISIGLLFGIGGATLFSIKLGEKKDKEAEKVLGNAFMLLILSGILFSVVGQLGLEPILNLFGSNEDIMPFAMDYMRVILFGATFQIVALGMNHLLRADGKPKMAMITMFVGAGLNILLDPLFIFVFKWGMAGAAFATIISQFISMCWVVYYFFKGKGNHSIYLSNLKIELKIFINIVSYGLPAFALQIANSVLNAILNNKLLEYGGNVAVSGMGVINSIQTLLLMPVIGLNQGVQPIISYNFGARKFKRILEAEKIAIFYATLIVLIGWLSTRLFPETLVRLFNQEPDLLTFGKFGLTTWFLMMPVVGFQIIASNFFQAIGRPYVAMTLTLTRQVILLIPAILLFSNYYGLDGILYAAPFADMVSVLITLGWYYFGIKQLKSDKLKQMKPILQLEE